MVRIRKQREILDRKALATALKEVAEWSGVGPKTQPKILEILKKHLAAGWGEVRRRFEEEGITGTEAVRSHAFLIDQIIRTLHDFAMQHVYPLANPTTGEQLTIVATGGYGRGELAPYSDIDLLFLLPYKKTPHSEQMVEYLLYLLWDLGLKVGHATRSVDDCVRLAKEDLTIRTSMLEARFLSGDQALFQQFKGRYDTEVISGSGARFVDAKLAERDDRHGRMGDSRYVLEPNIKEGKGGLRDLHTLFWLAKYLYKVKEVRELVDLNVLTAQDNKRFSKAQNFLWTVRCHLHYLTGRPEEHLTFNLQPEISARMNYTDHAGTQGVERFMKHYFLTAKDVGDLTRILCAVLEEQHKKKVFRLSELLTRRVNVPGFAVDANRIGFVAGTKIEKDPVGVIRLFHAAQKHGLDVHPDAMRLVRQNLNLISAKVRNDSEANRLFLDILCDPKDNEAGLRLLNEAGVFGRFLPDFGRVVAQMQYDMYHVYTVDEHTIRALGILNRIERGELERDHPIASKVIHEVQSREALYVSVLLHDIAKGRGGDHSELGAEVALKLGPRLGLSEWETETVSWLVLHHLAMSHTAFKRDLDDPQTVDDFVKVVQSPERLRLLLLLTVVDIRAVGPGVWNSWKAGLLRDLYYRALAVLAGELPTDLRQARARKARDDIERVLSKTWKPEAVQAYLSMGHDGYWLDFDTETLLHHATLIMRAKEGGLDLHIETRTLKERGATEIIIYCPDHPGLFSRIAGGIALSGASIVDAKIATLTDGMALDTFYVQSKGEAIEDSTALKKLWRNIGDALSGQISPAKEIKQRLSQGLKSRTEVFTVAPRVLVDNKVSRHHTVIEVNARDRLGLLHDVTGALTRLGLQISSAHISTYGERAVDVFYVKDVFGLKIEHEEKLKRIGEELYRAVSPESPTDKPKVDPKKPAKKPSAKKLDSKVDAKTDAKSGADSEAKLAAKSESGKSKSKKSGSGQAAE